MELWKTQLSQRGRGETSNPCVHWQAICGIKPESAWQLSPALNPNLLSWDMISTACIMIRKAQDEPWRVVSMDCICVLETWALVYEAGYTHTLEIGLLFAPSCFISLLRPLLMACNFCLYREKYI